MLKQTSQEPRLSVVVVDDEKMGRDALKILIRNYVPELRILGMADSVEQAVPMIREFSPDLVLLDIDMPNGSGFDLFEHFPNPSFKVIFVTAHDQYAVRAFRFAAVDYLLKPIDLEELESSIARIAGLDKQDPQALHVASSMAHPQAERRKRIAIPVLQGLEILEVDQVVRMEAENNYTYIFLESGGKQLVSKPLAHFEDLLEHSGFLRVHSSHLVNVNFIHRYVRGRGGHLEMKDSSTVPVASRRKNMFLDWINHHH